MIVSSMSKRTGVAAMLLFAGLFLVLNRAAYKGYFQDDELDTLQLGSQLPAAELSARHSHPAILSQQFPPRGHLYFHEIGSPGSVLDFPMYVAVLHFCICLTCGSCGWWRDSCARLLRPLSWPASSSASTWRSSTPSGNPCTCSTCSAAPSACWRFCSGPSVSGCSARRLLAGL